jgi:hypothetical protein
LNLHDALTKLRVKSGGLPGYQDTGNWTLRLGYDNEHSQFTLTLRYRPSSKEKTIGLKREYVETKGKSNWLKDNTWRLSPLGIETMTSQIEPVIASHV